MSSKQATWREMGLSQSEYDKILQIMQREPTYPELGMFSAMWSEHCSYKTSKNTLRLFPTSGKRILQGPGENAGVIDIGDHQAIAFKVESHNHPSAIEPFQGAATGVGGIIRDIFTMGARPIACLDSLRFGDLSHARVRYLVNGVVDGIAAYGNCMGIPTVAGETGFHSSYNGNPLVNAMCVGIIEGGRIYKGIAAGAGNPIMAVGARTGRDGIHGATFASVELSAESESRRPAVQCGDPFMEKLLLEACLELMQTDAVVGIQDMGAAGLTSSSCEMAGRGGCGIDFDVTLVPQRETGMTPYEILLSESQERMVVVVEKGREAEVTAIFDKWGLEAAVIGHVTDDHYVTVRENGKIVAHIPTSALTDEAPLYNNEAKRPAYLAEKQAFDPMSLAEPTDPNQVLRQLLASPNICSKEWVYRHYDYMVRTSTVIRPGSDAAVLRIKGTHKGLAMTIDCNSRYVYLDPLTGGKIAVAEAARNLVCSGAEPLAITNCLNFGNPEKPEVFYSFQQAVSGMAEACRLLDTPVTGGNVSFYNENQHGAVYPTPTVGMIGLLENIDHATRQGFRSAAETIYLVGESKNELGGSEYLAQIHQIEAGMPPAIDLDREVGVQHLVLKAIQNGLISAAHDCSEGGLAIALAEMAIAGSLGAVVQLQDNLRSDASLFGESQSRILVTVPQQAAAAWQALTAAGSLPVRALGVTGGDRLEISQNGKLLIQLPLNEITTLWKEALPCALMTTN
ncbi:MAG: phosphoribosylformylglycinamidine synthase subunit PurL [Negativicutes bacterium]|nr:phosphoribosylformylglycinamidine synthase subunit PurL [Negativicutes bacterium]